MSISSVLGIFGILVSLLFGAWGVFLALRRRYPGEITFVTEQTISLFDAIIKDLPELTVLYREAPVSPNVVLLKGSLVNTGKKDISPSMTEKPITLSLPAQSKWLSAGVISASPDVKASVDVPNANEIILTNGLLRRDEFIRFQALAELAPQRPSQGQSVGDSIEKRLEKSLKFEHRIEDTRSVRRVELPEAKRFISRRLRFYIVMPAVGLVLSVLMVILPGPLGIRNKFAYDLQIGNNQLTRVTIQQIRGDSVRVKSLDGKFKAAIGINEFFSKCRNHPVIIEDRSELVMMVTATIFIYIFLPSFVLSFALREYWVNKKLRRLLALDGSNKTQGTT